jgi:hypothetical protein
MLLLMCLFALGCSGKVKVSGTVTYSDTGEPVKFGMVVFTGEKEMGRGAINNGKYSVGIVEDGDGIPPGKYTIASDSLDLPKPIDMGMTGMGGTVVESGFQSQGKEIYYTKDPKTIDIKKSMKYDFTVERGSPQR